jgi:molybdopterin/thiamine biosynthesis adenylyltransferase
VKSYYDRQIKLWGEDKQKNLTTKKVAIIGSGGLGCSVALALSGSGIGEFYLVDFDEVEIHNIHRQIAFKTSSLNEPKAKVLAKLVEDRNPHTKANFFIEDFNSFSKRELIPDLIIDATDNLQARSDIDRFAKKHNIPWIYGSVEEFNSHVCLFDKKDFSAFKIQDKEPVGIAAPMVMQTAAFQANLALRYLADLSVKSDLLYFLYFNQEGELETKKFQL